MKNTDPFLLKAFLFLLLAFALQPAAAQAQENFEPEEMTSFIIQVPHGVEGNGLAVGGSNLSTYIFFESYYNENMDVTLKLDLPKVFGEYAGSKNPYSFAGRIRFVFQNPDLMLFCDSAEEEARFGSVQLKFKNIEERAKISLGAMSIFDLREDFPQSLSRGQRLRTAVASVLSIDPELILLDETTTGQDRVNIEQMMDYFKNKGSTLVFCTLGIEIEMLYATRILVMNEGQIIADGKGRDIIKNIDILRKASLTQPPVVEIANYLGIDAFSITELIETLTRRSSEAVKC
jgi:energy-coupling factor transport system ATP-binding protein